MARQPLLNLRLPQATHDALGLLAKRDGKTVSAFVRELIELAVAADGVAPFRTRSVELRLEAAHMKRDGDSLAQVGGCLHPVTARRNLPFTVVCGLCDAVVKRL